MGEDAAQNESAAGISGGDDQAGDPEGGGTRRLVIVDDGRNEIRQQDHRHVGKSETDQYGDFQASGRVPGTDPLPHLELNGHAVEKDVQNQEDDAGAKVPRADGPGPDPVRGPTQERLGDGRWRDGRPRLGYI